MPKARSVLRAQRDHKGQLDRWARPVLKDLRDRKARQDRLGLRARLGRRDHRELPVILQR